MTTWKLWRALRNPPALHPVFLRTVLLPYRPKPPSTTWAGMVIKSVLSLGEYSPTLLIPVIPLIWIILGITYGLDCALRVGSAIAREHENDTFNLLSLSPAGALGASWAICTSTLYRNRDFDRLREIVRASMVVGAAFILILGLTVLVVHSDTFSRFPAPPEPTIVHTANFLGVIAALYLEFVQSTLLGCLLGMFIPTYAHGRLDSSLYAVGGYLLLQVTTYLLAFFIGFVILPDSLNNLPFKSEYIEIVLTVLRLFVFFLIREVTLTILWRLLIERLNAYPSELDLVIQAVP